MRAALFSVLAVAAALLIGGAEAASRPRTASVNPANDRLVKLPPAERAAMLAEAVGHWCIGTETFLMGVVTEGNGQGNAYWSLRCADGTAWAVQIDPAAEIVAIDCESFKADGAGKECFKKF